MIDYNRTFGLELEFGDIVKDKVKMPQGYKFSKEEKSVVNTNLTKGTISAPLGGEINTRPLTFTRKDIRELRNFIHHCFDCGGVPMWNTGFDGHLYIGDLNLEQLKNIFVLGYYVSPYLYKFFNLGKWFSVGILVPIPTIEYYKKIKQAQSFQAIKNALSNSSNKGCIRFPINIMPYFKTKTLEFRIFNGTFNFRETLQTIKFMYNFLQYGLTHTQEDFKKINEHNFFETFGVKPIFPKSIPPMIFAQNHNEPTRNIAQAYKLNNSLMSVLIKNIRENKKVVVLNPFDCSLELTLYKDKDLTLYFNDMFYYFVWDILINGRTFEYKEPFAFLNKYKIEGDSVRECVLMFLFKRIGKFNSDNDYCKMQLKNYEQIMEKNIQLFTEDVKKIKKLFENSKIKFGVLNDVFQNQEKDSVIIYQQQHNPKNNGCCGLLKKFAITKEIAFEQKQMSYYNLQCANEFQNFYIFSLNHFLPYHKLIKDGNQILYSSKEGKQNIVHKQTTAQRASVSYEIPPDDFEITKNSKFEIFEVSPKVFSVLQKKHVKKVLKTTMPKYAFFVVDKDTNYILGAFGFDYPKREQYDLFLLSDFVTNNNVKMLSKLIPIIVKTKDVKQMLEERLLRRLQKKGYTYVYTTLPQSMKYRGVFDKTQSDKSNAIMYTFTFGQIASMKQARNIFISKIGKTQR